LTIVVISLLVAGAAFSGLYLTSIGCDFSLTDIMMLFASCPIT
jgi:hypothetical protein